MSCAQHAGRQRLTADHLLPLGLVLPRGALNHDDLAVGRDAGEDVVGDEVLAGEFVVAVVAAAAVAARVGLAGPRPGQRRRLGDPGTVLGPMAAARLPPGPARAVVLRRRPVVLTGTHVGIPDDPFIESPDRAFQTCTHDSDDSVAHRHETPGGWGMLTWGNAGGAAPGCD